MVECLKHVEIIGLLKGALVKVKGYLKGGIFYEEPYSPRNFIPTTECESKAEGRLVIVHIEALND